MRILLDECVPRPLKRELSDYEVRTVVEMGGQFCRGEAFARQFCPKDDKVYANASPSFAIRRLLLLPA